MFQAQKLLQTSPYFFIDALYMHQPPSDENKCEVSLLQNHNTVYNLQHLTSCYSFTSFFMILNFMNRVCIICSKFVTSYSLNSKLFEYLVEIYTPYQNGVK